MKGRTKPKGFGIAATVLLASLLIAAVSAPASARGLGGISGVPAHEWHCGCAPTASGNHPFFHFLQIRGY